MADLLYWQEEEKKKESLKNLIQLNLQEAYEEDNGNNYGGDDEDSYTMMIKTTMIMTFQPAIHLSIHF